MRVVFSIVMTFGLDVAMHSKKKMGPATPSMRLYDMQKHLSCKLRMRVRTSPSRFARSKAEEARFWA